MDALLERKMREPGSAAGRIAMSPKYRIDWFKRQVLGRRSVCLGAGVGPTRRSAVDRARDRYESILAHHGRIVALHASWRRWG